MKYGAFILYAILIANAGELDSNVTRARLLYDPYQKMTDKQYSMTYIDANTALVTHLELLKSSDVIKRVLNKIKNKTDIYDIHQNLVVNQVKVGNEKTYVIEITYPKKAFSVELINSLCSEYFNWRKEWDLKSINRLLENLEIQLKDNKTSIDSLENICINKFGTLSGNCKDNNTPEQDHLLRQLSSIHAVEEVLRKKYEETLLSKDEYFPDLVIIDPAH